MRAGMMGYLLPRSYITVLPDRGTGRSTPYVGAVGCSQRHLHCVNLVTQKTKHHSLGSKKTSMRSHSAFECSTRHHTWTIHGMPGAVRGRFFKPWWRRSAHGGGGLWLGPRLLPVASSVVFRARAAHPTRSHQAEHNARHAAVFQAALALDHKAAPLVQAAAARGSGTAACTSHGVHHCPPTPSPPPF